MLQPGIHCYKHLNEPRTTTQSGPCTLQLYNIPITVLAKLNHFPSALCGSGTDNKQNKFQDLHTLSIMPKHTSRIPKNKSEQDWFNQSNRDQNKTNQSPSSASVHANRFH